MPRTLGTRIAILALILPAPAVLHAHAIAPFSCVRGVSLDGWGLDDSGADLPFLTRLQSASGDVVDEYDLDICPGIAALGDGCAFTGGAVHPAEEGGEDILPVRYH